MIKALEYPPDPTSGSRDIPVLFLLSRKELQGLPIYIVPGASHSKTNQVERAVDTPADFTSPEELYKDLIKL